MGKYKITVFHMGRKSGYDEDLQYSIDLFIQTRFHLPHVRDDTP
jgi:hypothetical protein